nr:hypothetical protein JVH1_0620 [Rhodococcus sp. JVH1]
MRDKVVTTAGGFPALVPSLNRIGHECALEINFSGTPYKLSGSFLSLACSP